MEKYVKLTDEGALQYPAAKEFPGVINYLQHDAMLRSKGYCPLRDVPEEKEGKVLRLDAFELHKKTKERTEPRPVEVPYYSEDPETHEQVQSGTHREWQDTVIEVDDSYVTVTKFHYEDAAQPIETVRAEKLRELDAWDNAELPELGVNWFTVSHEGQELKLWIKKADRSALALTVRSAEAAGKGSLDIWADGVKLQVPVDRVMELLYLIEAYASECYCVTAQHRKNIESSDDAQYILGYDIRSGYPEHPVFAL